MIPRIILCMGAERVEAVGCFDNASRPLGEYDYVVFRELDEATKAPAMKNLPQELFDMVEGYVVRDSRREAEEDREALMEERSNFVVMLNEDVFEMEFAMCEH